MSIATGCAPSVGEVPYVSLQGESAGIFNGKIVNATDQIAKHTVMIVIRADNSLMSCSGSLIAPNLILTAAHCFMDSNNRKFRSQDGAEVRVKFGVSFNLAADGELEKGHLVPLENVAVGNYDPDTYEGLDNDVALIKLVTPAPKGYVPVPLVVNAGANFWSAEFLLAGFGNTDFENEPMSLKPFQLRSMKTKAFSAQPQKMKKIVLVSTTTELSPYKGDSGGPAFITLGGRLYLWGVSSRATPELFHAYIAVFQHLSWLKKAAHGLGVKLEMTARQG